MHTCKRQSLEPELVDHTAVSLGIYLGFPLISFGQYFSLSCLMPSLEARHPHKTYKCHYKGKRNFMLEKPQLYTHIRKNRVQILIKGPIVFWISVVFQRLTALFQDHKILSLKPFQALPHTTSFSTPLLSNPSIL